MASIEKRTSKGGAISHRVRWRERSDDDASWTYRSETFPSAANARTFRGAVEAAGEHYPPGWIPGFGFVEEEKEPSLTLEAWFPRAIAARTRAAERTKSDYHRDFALHVPDWLKVKHLDEITPEDAGRWVNGLTGAPKTRKNVHGLLSSVLNDAVANGLAKGNPFAGRGPKDSGAHVDEMIFLTPQEVSAVANQMPHDDAALVWLLYGTGLRWGEATALQVKAVDLMARRLRVMQAWKRGSDNALRLGEPKNAKSRRTVSLSARLVDLLVPYVSAPKQPEAFVFQTATGKPIRHGNWNERRWRPAVKAAGLGKEPRIHDLRHSHVALLASQGVPLLAISRRLGHSTITTTADRYGHLLPEVDDKLSQAVDVGFAALRDSFGVH